MRRHVEMTATHHIGKESHDWERQAMIGLSADSEIEFGVANTDRAAIAAKMRAFIAEYGERKAATALGISAMKLRTLCNHAKGLCDDRTMRVIAAKLPAAIALLEKLRNDRHAETERLCEAVSREGLRPVARRIGINPSNLRRKLHGEHDLVEAVERIGSVDVGGG